MSGLAVASNCSLLIKPFLYAISSMQAYFNALSLFYDLYEQDACINESKVPVSSQAVPLSKKRKLLSFRGADILC